MRLIHTESLQLKEFHGSNIPPYAILSHTWGDEEVTFQEWIREDEARPRDKNGYQKITRASDEARKDGLEWLWVDTVCIDRTSSAELSEAINSMYAWYRDAVICYAYLVDVLARYGPSHPAHLQGRLNQMAYMEIHKSRWFTRGWTLQELLAPKKVRFYSLEWDELSFGDEMLFGTSNNRVIEISKATGISEEYLSGRRALSDACVAERMSWLSRRTTTRVEDMAYCALGIFDINMPLLYGEGRKAFVRLQEHIVRESNDHTIFCWSWNDDVPSNWTSMLAPHPSTFKHCGDLRRVLQGSHSPFSITNIGLSLSAPVRHTADTMIVCLDAYSSDDKYERRLCVSLGRFPGSNILHRLPSVVAPISSDVAVGDSSSVHQLAGFTRHGPHYRFYIQHKPRTELSTLRFGTETDFINSEICMMLFLSSEKQGHHNDRDQLPDPPKLNANVSDFYDLQGSPRESYFSGDGLLRLSYFEGQDGRKAVFAGALKLKRFKSDDLYLFFALEASKLHASENRGRPEEGWHHTVIQESSILKFLNYPIEQDSRQDALRDLDVLSLLVDDFQQRGDLTAYGRRPDRFYISLGHTLSTMRKDLDLKIKPAYLYIRDTEESNSPLNLRALHNYTRKNGDPHGEMADWLRWVNWYGDRLLQPARWLRDHFPDD